MKKLLLGFLMLFAFIAFAQDPSLPIDMEDPADDAWVANGVVYSLETALFPSNSGKIVDLGTVQFDSRVDLAMGTYIDMTTPSKTFTFEFYTDQALAMTGLFQISLEKDGGFPIEMQFTTDGVIGWETITLDFTNADNGYPNCQTCPDPQPVVYGQYAQVSIFTNFGSFDTGTYYFDDIAGAANGAVVPTESVPTVAAPTPTQDPGDVISMFSDAYTDVPVDTWLTVWSQGTLEDILVDGNPTKKYSNVNFVGVETVGPNLLDVTTMTHIHLDIWTPEPNDFKFKLVDFGPDMAFGGGDDTEHELTFPAPATETWISYDIPLSAFTGLNITGNMAQYIFVKAPTGTFYLDNMFFYFEAATEPTVAAPTPTQDPGDVISMFSDAYTDVPVDTWLTVWSAATLEDVLIDGNPTKKYTNVDFFGVETVGPNLLDVTGMTHFYFDLWTPDANEFKVKLVDFGPDQAFGGGDDTEHELVFPAPATGAWISYDLPLSSFTNLNITGNMAQYIFVKAPLGTIFMDNVFFYAAPLSEPTVAAPTPTQDPGDVISMFSDAYTDVPVDTWLTVWSDASLEDVLIDGNPTKKYTDVNFFGVETTGPNLLDVTGMSHFHIDIWTPDANDLKIKLVDFGLDGIFGGGDDTEHELTFPAPTTGTWISYDLPLSDFTNLNITGNMAQYIFVKAPLGTIFMDNMYFWRYPASTTWTGAVDSNWDDAGNWSNGVPTALLNATIPDVGANPYPVITASADANNISVAAAATLTIAPGGDLTTAGEVDVDGNFYMSSDASGVSASFIEQGVTGGGTFQFDRDLFCSGSNPANEADPFGWHYLSAPINGLTTDDLLDYYVNQWDEVGNVWMNFEGTAPCIPYATEYLDDLEAWSLNLDTEYDCQAPGTGSVIEFSGPFNAVHSGGFSTPVTASGGSFSGWNMIGNPYPSAIDPAAFNWTGFDNGTYGVAIYEGCTGNYLYSNLGNGYSYKVGPTQGFFMLTSGATDFALDGSERVHDNGTTIYKDAVANLLTIEATGDGTSDLAYIRFMDDSQSGMDKADFPKLISTTEGLAQIYTTSGEDMLAVNALPATPIVPMGFTSVTTGEYTISAIEANDFSNVVLEDRFTGVQTDLLNDSYTFNYTVSDDANRFFVHFTPLGIGDNAAASINIWSSDHNIYVETPEINGDIVVFNMMGQEVTRTQVEAGVNVIPVSEVNAFYVVKIVGSEVAKTGKVYVK